MLGSLVVLLPAPRVAGTPRSSTLPGQAPAIAVFPGHPRLIVGGYRGVGVDGLRAACRRPELVAECAQIGGRHVLDDAMRYLLTDEQAAANRVADVLRGWTGCGAGDVGAEHSPWGGWALAYDWTWAGLPQSLRQQVDSNLANCGLAVARALKGNGPHLWHGYTSLAASLALMALATDSRTANGDLVRGEAVSLFRGNALEAYAVVGGAWPEGYGYERSHFFSSDPPYQYVMDALRAWDSAVERDHPEQESIFGTIAAVEGDWLRGLAYHLVYGTLDAYGPGGKRTLLRGGDMPTGQAWPNKQYRPFVDSIARVYGDGVLAGWGEQLAQEWNLVGGTGSYHPIHRYSLPYNLPLDVPTRAPFDLPAGRIWAREDLGYVLTRSSFGAGATLVGYRAGKWFTGHQHLDQGHLDLWRKGPLLVDAGVYANWGTEHREAFYLRSVAHNTLLVHLDGEDFDEHPGSGVNVNDDGQRVHTYARGGCPQCMQSVAEWRSHVGAGLHFEAGRIDAFEDGEDYTVVASDLTAAYNSPNHATPGNRAKVELAQRDLVYLRPGVLLVTDRVRPAPGASAPRAAWHLPGRPALTAAQVVQGAPENGILTSATASFTFDNGTGGQLAGQVLLPEAARLTAYGGPGYRYWVDGANRSAGAAPHEGPPAEPGLWRVEMGPPDGWKTDLRMVTALAIGDSGAVLPTARAFLAPGSLPADPPTLVASVADGGATWVVVRSGAGSRGIVSFAHFGAPTAQDSDWLLADAQPGATYYVGWGPPPDVLRHRRVAGRASAEGVVRFAMPAVDGELTLAACPAPVTAGSRWAALCDPSGGTETPTSAGTPSPAASATAGGTATATTTAEATATARAFEHRVLLPWGGRR